VFAVSIRLVDCLFSIGADPPPMKSLEIRDVERVGETLMFVVRLLTKPGDRRPSRLRRN
jgi:hypothetical protein